MDPNSPDALFQALRDSGLHPPDQLAGLDAVTPELRADPPLLADYLKKSGLLNGYQAKKVKINRITELLVGPYLILDKVGEGGMGKVYKAVQQRIGRLVALKIVRPHLLSNKTVMKRYQREAKATGELSHDNIVRTFDADEAGGRYFLAMEFVNGSDLSRLVKEFGRLHFAEAAEYVRQAALGLQHAHDRGFVHRDIKPSNILVSGERALPGTGGKALVKLLDLGLVRSLTAEDDGHTDLTRDGTVVGTPDYMSPEQAKNSSTVDGRADLYSLGGTLFYLLAGKPPFPDGSPIDKLLRHQLDPPPDLAKLRPDAPRGLIDIVNRLMRKKPDERYQTAAVTAEALAPFCPDAVGVSDLTVPPGGPVVPDGETIEALDAEVVVTAGEKAAAARPATRPAPRRPAMAPVKLAAREAESGTLPRPRTPVNIPKPITGQSSTSIPGAGGADTPELFRRRRSRRGVDWLPIAFGAGGVIALAVIAAFVFRPPKDPTPVATGKDKEPPPVTQPGTESPKPVVAARGPVGWNLPDGTAAALVLHPEKYWKVAQEKALVRPDSRLGEWLNALAAGYRLDPRACDRLTLALPAGPPRQAVAVAEGPFLSPAWIADTRRHEHASPFRLDNVPLLMFENKVTRTPVLYAGFLDDRGYAVGGDKAAVAGLCKRAGAKRNPTGTAEGLLAALPAADAADPPLAVFAADAQWLVPGVGRTVGELGAELVVVTVRLTETGLAAEVVVHGPTRKAVEEFISLGFATKLAAVHPTVKRLVLTMTDGGANWTPGGKWTTAKMDCEWELMDLHDCIDALLPKVAD